MTSASSFFTTTTLVLCLLGDAGTSASTLHGTFSKEIARKLAHRWRPLPPGIAGGAPGKKWANIGAYARVIIELEFADSFGIVEDGDDEQDNELTLFVVRRQNRANPTIVACLSTRESTEEMLLSTYRTIKWYDQTFDAKLKVALHPPLSNRDGTSDGGGKDV